MSNLKSKGGGELLKKLTNPGTLIALSGMLGLLLNQFGLNVDLEWLDRTVDIICTILVILGVFNNPNTPGVDNPFEEE